MPKRPIDKTAPTDATLVDLRAMIDRRQVVVIVGAGVSVATNHGSPSWRALIDCCVVYHLSGTKSASAARSKKSPVDYREVLSEEDFAVYSELRDRRSRVEF